MFETSLNHILFGVVSFGRASASAHQQICGLSVSKANSLESAQRRVLETIFRGVLTVSGGDAPSQ